MSNSRSDKSQTTYKVKAYNFIYVEIAKGRFASGKRIVAKNIADELGISQAPVREAIMELASNGLIEYRPRQGALVRDITKNEIYQYWKMRTLVEPFAASQAAKYASDKDLINIEKRFETMRDIAKAIFTINELNELQKSFIKFNLADMRFHMDLLESTKNTALIKFGQLLIDAFCLNGIKRSAHLAKPALIAIVKEGLDSHLVLLRALLKREPQQAEKAMWDSLTLGENNIFEQESYSVSVGSDLAKQIDDILIVM